MSRLEMGQLKESGKEGRGGALLQDLREEEGWAGGWGCQDWERAEGGGKSMRHCRQTGQHVQRP